MSPGLSFAGPELAGKQIQLLKEIVPGVSRMAILSNPGNPFHSAWLGEANAAKRSLRVQLQVLEAQLGYREGQNLLLAVRSAERQTALAGPAQELVQLKVDVIVAGGVASDAASLRRSTRDRSASLREHQSRME
jgi:putative ABC transport system substrate-binding protein